MSSRESVDKRPGNPPVRYQDEDCWQFVNVSGRKETQSAQIRRLVRANAARTHWQRYRKRGQQSHAEAISSCERDDSGRHRNSMKACNNQEMPCLSADVQAMLVELEPPSRTSGSVHSLGYPKYAVHTGSQQDEDTSTELPISLAVMQASTVPSPVTLGCGAIDVRISGLLWLPSYWFSGLKRSLKSLTASISPENSNADPFIANNSRSMLCQ